MATYTTPRRPGPREADAGYLIHLARQRGVYVHQTGQSVWLQDTRTKTRVFEGSVPDAVAFIRDRAERKAP